MQNTFLYEGMSQCVRSLNRSDAYLRPLLYVNANLYGDHGQLHPALVRRRQAPTTESGRRPAHRLLSSLRCLSAPIWQAASQAGRLPQMDWFKLRFAFRWYSALLKRCRPRGQSTRRTQRLPRERAPAPKNQRAQVSQGEICPKETPQNHACIPQEWIGARTKA